MIRKRKARGDSKLDKLKPESRVLELRDLLLAGATYKEAKAWLLETCNTTTTGDALMHFWHRHCQPIKDEEMSLAAAAAEGLVDRAGAVDWDTAITEFMKQTTFEIISGQEVDAKTKAIYARNWVKLKESNQAAAKAREFVRSKEEAGIDALLDAVKGDKQAEDLLRQLNERLAKKGGAA